MSQPEKVIQNRCLLELGRQPQYMVWANVTGKFRYPFGDDPKLITIGNPGAPDALGVQAITITADMVGKTIGQAIALEFKTDSGRQSPEQKAWQLAFERRGGIYRLVRSTVDLIQQ